MKRSGIAGAGLGLFAGKKRIKKDKSVAKYTGEQLSRQAVEKRYGKKTGQYVLCGSKTKCVDARRTDTPGLGRWANDARGSGRRPNAKLTAAYTIKSTRNIAPHSEILVGYGKDYWKR